MVISYHEIEDGTFFLDFSVAGSIRKKITQ